MVTEEGADLFDAYRWLKNYGHLPVPGGIMQQSAAFVDAVAWCDAVNAAFIEYRDRRNADVSKMQSNLQKMLSKNAVRKS